MSEPADQPLTPAQNILAVSFIFLIAGAALAVILIADRVAHGGLMIDDPNPSVTWVSQNLSGPWLFVTFCFMVSYFMGWVLGGMKDGTEVKA